MDSNMFFGQTLSQTKLTKLWMIWFVTCVFGICAMIAVWQSDFSPWQRFRHSRGELSGVALWPCGTCGTWARRCFRSVKSVHPAEVEKTAKTSEGFLWSAKHVKQGSFHDILYIYILHTYLKRYCRILVTGPIMPFPKVFPAGSVIELCGAAVLRISEDCNWAVFAPIFSPKETHLAQDLSSEKWRPQSFHGLQGFSMTVDTVDICRLLLI